MFYTSRDDDVDSNVDTTPLSTQIKNCIVKNNTLLFYIIGHAYKKSEFCMFEGGAGWATRAMGEYPIVSIKYEHIPKFLTNNKKEISLYNNADETFGDIKLFDVGLGEFFSLIKNAECVFTDSFHAVCFSWIFKTRFYVFDRDVGFDGTKMSSRIDSILKLMNLEDRKIDCDSNVDLEQNVNFESEDLCDMITKSRKYLDDALRD